MTPKERLMAAAVSAAACSKFSNKLDTCSDCSLTPLMSISKFNALFI